MKKAKGRDIKGRFREIIADPLNLLIRRHARAGAVEGDLVVLHNGNKVPFTGEDAYYGELSDILIINRGVHEPLEEYVFQQLLDTGLPTAPLMLELGAYWGHYSMWLKLMRPQASVVLVEPDKRNLRVGQANFARNGFKGEFIRAAVGTGRFEVDAFLKDKGVERLDILHSDIQGAEGEMIEGAMEALTAKRIDYLCISTHSNALHYGLCERLSGLGYRLEASSDFEAETTSFDGFLFASSPLREPVLKRYVGAGRLELEQMTPRQNIERLAAMIE